MRLIYHREPGTNVHIWSLELTEKEMGEVKMSSQERSFIEYAEFNIHESLFVLALLAQRIELDESKEQKDARHEEAVRRYNKRQLRDPQPLQLWDGKGGL